MANYVIVGGTSGIGLAISNVLADNHEITVVSRKPSDKLHSSIKHISLDVLSDDVASLDFNQVDGVVYCPGSINLKPFKGLKDEDFLNDFNINVLGAVRVLRVLENKLKKSDNASVVLFSTVAVTQGMPFHASTAAAKAALEGLGKSLAAEWAPKVRVNIVAPSITDTPMASHLLATDDKRKKSGDRHPLKSVGDPEDIAAYVEFLLSHKAKWITGQVLGIDGGMSTLRSLQ